MVEDSLRKVELNNQLAKLKQSNKREKAILQKSIDSLRSVQEERKRAAAEKIKALRSANLGSPVLFFSDTLFFIYAKAGSFLPKDRAFNIQQKLERIVDEGTYDFTKISKQFADDEYDILYDDLILLTVTERDGFWYNQTTEIAADDIIVKIIAGVDKYEKENSWYNRLLLAIKLILILVLLLISIKLLLKLFTIINKNLISKSEKYLTGFKIKNYEILTAERELQLIIVVLKGLKWLFIVFVLYLTLPLVFSVFPSTRDVASTLLGYVLDPLVAIFKSVFSFIPSLITIIVIIFCARYFVKFLQFLANEIQEEKLKINGFYPDWAKPTFNLLKIIVYAFSFVVIFPYLPGSDSNVFQGVSVFFGLLISMGSSSAISNIIAGLVITYMRPFRIGERVKIGDVTGDVIEKTMLVTRVRTIKNEDITIPNSSILSGYTTNYSSSAKNLGLILNTTITIGYDVPWKTVEGLLIKAAEKTSFIKLDPKPFVLQTSLDDFYVSYQLNAYTEEAHSAAKIYSQMHANIQDGFNEAGIEIMSPHYRADRDGNTSTIPAENLPKDYVAPSFKVKIEKDGKL